MTFNYPQYYVIQINAQCMLPYQLTRTTSITQIARNIYCGSAESIARLKRPTRGGQNLTNRHRRLENSLRGKEARLREIDILSSPSSVAQSSSTVRKHTSKTFRGFVVPEEPKPPAADGTSLTDDCSHLVDALSVQNVVCLVVQYAFMIYT